MTIRTGLWQQYSFQGTLGILQLTVEGSAHCGWVISDGTINAHIGNEVIQLLQTLNTISCSTELVAAGWSELMLCTMQLSMASSETAAVV